MYKNGVIAWGQKKNGHFFLNVFFVRKVAELRDHTSMASFFNNKPSPEAGNKDVLGIPFFSGEKNKSPGM